MAASGVTLRLSSSNGASVDNDPLSTSDSGAAIGGITGSVNFSQGSPRLTMLQVGSNFSRIGNRALTASLDPTDKDYFANVFNKDPQLLESKGHVLYSHYDIHSSYAVVTGTGLTPSGVNIINGSVATHIYSGSSEVAFLLTGTQARNAGAAASPNYENFRERFQTAASPFVVSQKLGGASKNLFQVHMLSDGVTKGRPSDTVGSNTKYKIAIEGLAKSTDPVDKYGQFDLIVRDFYDTDAEQYVYESHRGLSLNPDSTNYIARRIGDQNLFFDFDKSETSQKLVIEGKYPNVSSRIRVSMDSEVDNGSIDSEALPIGFRGLAHLNTSGSQGLTHTADNQNRGISDHTRFPIQKTYLNTSASLAAAVQPPVPLRLNLNVGASPRQTPDRRLYWGVQFTQQASLTEPNKSRVINPTISSLTKYFPDFSKTSLNFLTGNNAGQNDENGFILDCDRFNNNGFTLENVRVVTGSDGLMVDNDEALTGSTVYVRAGAIVADADAKTRAFKVDDLAAPAATRLAKFVLPMQGGFDGVNIFDKNESAINNNAVIGEMLDANRGQTSGPAVAAYRKALSIMGEKSDADIQLLAIPGIRHEAVTDQAITTVEDRFDAMYIMDIEERDELNSVVTGSNQRINIANTARIFGQRTLDSSFAAAYFPDVNMNVQTKILDNVTRNIVTQTSTVRVPPSVGVLGAFGFNDKEGHPWFAPAGFRRGSIAGGESAAVSPINSTNADTLSDKKINTIQTFPGSDGPVVFGQRTLQAAATALDRVNVRRLLIDVRRKIRDVARDFIFEPNREATLQAFSARVTPILQQVQQNQGLDRFRVVIDSSTTTQTDIENNTVRGKIFLQPTRTAEFISLDFVVTNAGVDGI